MTIPARDAMAPILCTIDDDEVPARIEVLERMRSDLARTERTEHGMRLHFPPRAGTEVDLRSFAVDEKRCCRFWTFAVDSTAEDLVLPWEGPPGADPLIARLVAYFTGDEVLTCLSGLL